MTCNVCSSLATIAIHDAWPVGHGRCCDACNNAFVKPARATARRVVGHVDGGPHVVCVYTSLWDREAHTGSLVFFSPHQEAFRTAVIVTALGGAVLRRGEALLLGHPDVLGMVSSTYPSARAELVPRRDGVEVKLKFDKTVRTEAECFV